MTGPPLPQQSAAEKEIEDLATEMLEKGKSEDVVRRFVQDERARLKSAPAPRFTVPQVPAAAADATRALPFNRPDRAGDLQAITRHPGKTADIIGHGLVVNALN